jgi:hypothetical protein
MLLKQYYVAAKYEAYGKMMYGNNVYVSSEWQNSTRFLAIKET